MGAMVKDTETDAEKLMGFCLVLLLLVPLTLWRGYILTIIYNWYAPAAWPEVTLKVAVGLCLIIGMLSTRPSKDDQTPMYKVLANGILYGGLTPLLTLGFARVLLWVL
jgi:hypothetical protein